MRMPSQNLDSFEKLPFGVKTLEEIEAVQEDTIRIVLLGTLLEYLLREISSTVGAASLDGLISANKALFSIDVSVIHSARWTRNQVIHATGRVDQMSVCYAVRILRTAVGDADRAMRILRAFVGYTPHGAPAMMPGL